MGLSGGVDSAVTAALLQKEGAKVTGVFIKGWYPPGMPCTWSADRRDAMRVAASLHIPFKTLDASDEYKKGVIDYLMREYRAGRTPNPDVMCNREVKFGAFYRYAMAQGADYVATGHYARVEHGELERGRSAAKDQSYFLWAVPKEVLERTLFPLGMYEKSEVRKLARIFNLPVFDKPDSQGICFLGDISVEDFLRAELASESGTAVDETGVTIGTHDGALLYTLGERVALKDAVPGPWYIVAKDIEKNMLTVSQEPNHSPWTGAFALTDTNWLASTEAAKTYVAQYRYHGPRVLVRVQGVQVTPIESMREPIAAGQSLVVYDGDRLLGGGVIS